MKCKFCNQTYDAMFSYCVCIGQRRHDLFNAHVEEYIHLVKDSLHKRSPVEIIKGAAEYFRRIDIVIEDEIFPPLVLKE